MTGPAASGARVLLVLALLLLVGLDSLPLSYAEEGEDAVPAPRGEETREERQASWERLRSEAQAHEGARRWPELVRAAERLVATTPELFGEVHPACVTAWVLLARGQREVGEIGAAREAFAAALDVAIKLHGEDDWRVTNRRLALEDLAVNEALTAEQRADLEVAIRRRAEAGRALANGRFEDGIRLLGEVHRTCATILGVHHPDTLAQLSDVGSLHARMGGWAKAEPIWRRVLDGRLEVLGEFHPDTAKSLNDLAIVAARIGNPEEAERLWRRALAVRQRVLGPAHPDSVMVLTNLGSLFLTQQRLGEAEALLVEAWSRQRASPGGAGPDAMDLLATLGRLYARTGDHTRSAEYFALEVQARRHFEEDPTLNLGVALNNQGHERAELGELAAAERCFDEALAILQATAGDRDPRTATVKSQLGLLYRLQGRHARAVELCREALLLTRAVLGAEHPDTASALAILGLALQARGPLEEAAPVLAEALRIRRARLGEEHAATAESLLQWGTLLLAQARYESAETALVSALARHRALFGPTHPDTVICLQNLGSLYVMTSEREKALAHLRPALAILEESWGPDHPYRAGALSDLAATWEQAGEFTQAIALFEEVLAIQRRSRGPDHPATIDALGRLALARAASGDVAQAESLARESLTISERVHGGGHAASAAALWRLGRIIGLEGRYWEAVPLLERARDAYANAAEEGEAEPAGILTDLGAMNVLMGDPSLALHHLGRALEITRRFRGADHPATAEILDLLGILYGDLDDPEHAEPLLRSAYETRRKVFGPVHPKTILSLKNLAGLRLQTGAYAEAADLYAKALELWRTRTEDPTAFEGLLLTAQGMSRGFAGERAEAEALLREGIAVLDATVRAANPVRIRALLALSENVLQQGKAAEARTLLETGLALARRHLDLSFAVRSGRQQRAMAEIFRPALGAYLGMAGTEGSDPAAAYDVVLAWKGSGLAHLLAARAARSHPEHQRLLEELSHVSGRLAARSLSEPGPEDPADRVRQLGEWMRRREEIEIKLAQASAAYRETRALSRVTSADLSKLLPEGVCLLDFVTYHARTPAAEETVAGAWEEHLTVFVLCRDNPTKRVNLGPVAAVDAAADTWRRVLLQSPLREPRAAGEVLARLLWRPVAAHVGDAAVVLVSPVGAVSRVPFGALPGPASGSYLLESRAFAIVPVPQLLPRLLESSPPASPEDSAPALLLVGGVDYDAAGSGGEKSSTSPGAGVRRAAGDRPRFSRLAGTAREMDAVAALYAESFPEAVVHGHRGPVATESAFREQGPTCTHVHLATHGFFAPPGAPVTGRDLRAGSATLWRRSELRGLPPMLLSGLALCGANRVPEAGEDDGILTALEVSALDLERVDLAVLSACETGLGTVAGGEGVLGLQRAFQIAGARSTITTLWGIPDAATAKLMTWFYENLWQRKMTRIDALREAQLRLLREGAKEPQMLRGPLRRRQASPAGVPDRLPPFFWAAFVLSGEWRSSISAQR